MSLPLPESTPLSNDTSDNSSSNFNVLKNNSSELPCASAQVENDFSKKLGALVDADSRLLLRSLRVSGAFKFRGAINRSIIEEQLTAKGILLQDAIEASTSTPLRYIADEPIHVKGEGSVGANVGDQGSQSGHELSPTTFFSIAGYASIAGRSPARALPLSASEFGRLRHVLSDPRMLSQVTRMEGRKSRQDLDREKEDPWSEHFAPLFNDREFKPLLVQNLAGGVTREEISIISPSILREKRGAGELKKK